ncbi:MAG: InlB B-repeat-containing protein, partial [Clostridia bacterium]|nr:InlB B-repeat-containing protein [Clostridia bacterium]
MKKITRTTCFILFVLVALSIFFACAKPTYKVIFNSNGGTAVASIETDGKSGFRMPNPPTKSGYEFEDWYYDNVTFRDVFTAGSLVASPITSDITVYAKWNEILSATDGLEYALKEDDTYEVTGYGGTSVNVVVAETYNNIPVTSIKEN